MRRLWRCLVNGLLVLMMLGVGAPTVAQPEMAALAASGVYTEDFSSYAVKDYTDDTVWDVWSENLRLGRQDAVLKYDSVVAIDSDGNFFVVWEDNRNGNGDIYAQRLDANGNRLWATDLRVNGDSGTALQRNPAVALDEGGRAIVVWQDSRNSYAAIYAQRLDAGGNRLWATDMQIIEGMNPAVAVDRDGAAIVVWEDHRNSYNYGDIYAQRLAADGTRLWSVDIFVNTSDDGIADQSSPAVAVDESGQVIIVWDDYRDSSYGIYAQRLDSNGNRLWVTDAQVSRDSGASRQEYPAVTLDGNGRAIVAWYDDRNGNFDIYAQGLDTTGSYLWAADIRVNSDSGTRHQYSPAIAGDESGHAVVVWYDEYGYVYGQRLDASGNHCWSRDMQVIGVYGQGDLYAHIGVPPAIAMDESNNAIVVWRDSRNNSKDTYAQRLGINGHRLWVADARVNCDNGTAGQYDPVVAVDGSGNTIIVWQDYRNGNPGIYAQRLDASGNQLWSTDLRVNSGSMVGYYYPAVAVDGNGNTIIVWQDYRNGNRDIYAQRLDASGNRLWLTDLRVNSDSGTVSQYNPSVAVDGSGNAVIVWSDYRNVYADIYAQRLDASGNRLWLTDLQVNSDSGTVSQYNPSVAVDGSGNAIIVWSDSRNSEIYVRGLEVFAQRLDINGNRLWTMDVQVNRYVGWYNLRFPSVAMDGYNNAVVVWMWDGNDSFVDIGAQKLDINGTRTWLADVQVNSDSGHAATYDSHPSVAVDETGRAVVVWRDKGTGYHKDIHAQRLDTDGTRLWPGDVQVHSEETADQDCPVVGIDRNGNAIVAWEDYRNGNADIYVQRINQIGGKVWLADLQVVYPDMFHFPTGFAQSRSIDTLAADITQATLTADMTLNGGSVQFYLTNDGGAHWAAVTPGVTHVFTTTGSDLRWRAALRGDPLWRHRSPVINSLRIEYSTDAPGGDTYEPDDTCAQAQPLQVNGAAQQHTFHQYQDSDWGWFEARAGVTYTIQTGNTGARADIVLELYDSCGTPPIDEDDNAFGPGATLTFTAPVSGRYYVRVLQVDSSVYGAETEYDLSVRAQQPTGAAIIVAGRLNANDPVQPIINATANLAYQTLLRRGFAADDIYYLNSDTTQPGVDGTPTKAQLRDAVQDWARPRVGLGAPLWLFLADHGNVDRFHNEIAEVVTAEELNLWLSNLEATSGVDQINVILEACFSGSFIDTHQNGGWGAQEISGQGRVVVASTTSRWWAYAPPIVGGRPTPVMYFSGGFWRALGEGQTLWHAFLTGREEVEGVPIGKCGDYAYTCQRPWLDDTGDAWFDTSDGLIAQSRGLATAFAGEIAPYIDWVEVGEIQNGRATLRAQVRDDGSVTRVWARVFAPSFTLPTSTDGSIPVISVPEATLTHSVGDMFTVEYAGFTEPGAYQVVLYALDDEGRTSTPRAVLVGAQKVYLPLVIRQ